MVVTCRVAHRGPVIEPVRDPDELDDAYVPVGDRMAFAIVAVLAVVAGVLWLWG